MKRPPPQIENEMGSKRRRRLSVSDEDDCSRPSSVFKEHPPMHKIYNSACRKEKPDELFRKDLISAMKLPDSDQLDESEFWEFSDSWKQEWERGVQVPVNANNGPSPNVRIIHEKNKNAFKLPKKFMRTTGDSFFSGDVHVLTDTASKAESVCKYDMDDLDCQWLHLFNEKRDELGLSVLDEDTMERVLEDFETQCSNRFQDALKTEKGLGIEYDEDVICDVCRSPECEEGNEMVFCDSCNICVHQACYGITAIPEGSWICRPCALNIKPSCVLCPNTGGAMKSSGSGDQWGHVSCALWIPEVSIGCPEKMEPIMRISNIPTSRWALICSLCRERVGACIQCSVKQCKIAYHVTCAFENGLEMEMKTAAIDSSEEGVKMQSFCPKHSKTPTCINSPEKLVTASPVRKARKKKEVKNKDIPTNEVDEHNARLEKIRSLEAQFHKFVNVKDTSDLHHVDSQVVGFLFYYWVLKRRVKFNKPLLITKCDEANMLIKQHENLLYSRLKMFVHLRQDLERVRNLCYMVSRREKIFRSYIRVKRDIFEKQLDILTNKTFKLAPKEVEEVLRARYGNSLYDKFYCVDIEEEVKEEQEPSSVKLPNPYAKSYTNSVHTRSRRRTTSQNFQDGADDSESNEMPVLTKCKSEESLFTSDNAAKKESPSFTNTPFVVKVETNQNTKFEPQIKESIKCDLNDLEMPKITSEVLPGKSRKHSSIETSSDKNSSCLSDKENINACNPVKVRKTRSQSDLNFRNPELKNAIQDFSSPTLSLFDDESSLSISSDLNSPDARKNFRFDRRSTRYQMRNKRSAGLENREASLKQSDSIVCNTPLPTSPMTSSSSPSNDTGELLFLLESANRTEDSMPVLTIPSQTPRRGRGRPRKVILPEPEKIILPEPEKVILPEPEKVILPEPDFNKEDMIHAEKDNNDFESIQDLSDTNELLGFKMSLRHNRDHSIKKLPQEDSILKVEVPHIDKHVSDFNSILEFSDPNEHLGFRMSLRHNRDQFDKKIIEHKTRNKRSVIVNLDSHDVTPLKETNKEVLNRNESEGSQSSPDWNSEDAQLTHKSRKKRSVFVKFDHSKSKLLKDTNNEILNGTASEGSQSSLDWNSEDTPSKHKRKKKRSVIVKLDHSNSIVANKEVLNGTASEGSRSWPDWNSEDAQSPKLSSLEQPAAASTRIIIRLRKDPNRESWKNDSSSSSDVPVAFRIVRDDCGEEPVSEFPKLCKGGESLDLLDREDTEFRHRYSMRERSATSRSAKSR